MKTNVKHEIYMYFEQDIHSLSQGNGNKQKTPKHRMSKKRKRREKRFKNNVHKECIENGKKSQLWCMKNE